MKLNNDKKDLNFKDGMNAYCLDTIVDVNDLELARERIEKGRKVRILSLLMKKWVSSLWVTLQN